MEYFIYDQDIPARRNGTDLPELYIGGKWVKRNDPERWGERADNATEAEVKAMIKSIDTKEV